MSISLHAVRYAAALDALERARSWMKDPPKNLEVSVTWHAGSGCVGYKDVQLKVSALVAKQMPELLTRALHELDIEQARLGQQLTGAMELGRIGRMRAGEVS